MADDARLLADGDPDADDDDVGDDDEVADEPDVFRTLLVLASTNPDSLFLVRLLLFVVVDDDFKESLLLLLLLLLLFDVFDFKFITVSDMELLLLLNRNFLRNECGVSVHSMSTARLSRPAFVRRRW